MSPTVGTYIETQEEFDALPNGTRLHNDYGNVIQKVDGTWHPESEDREEGEAPTFGRRRFTVASLPEGDTGETLIQYQWRFVETIQAAVEAHGIDENVMATYFEEVGVDPADLPLFTGVAFRTQRGLDTVPERTIVHTGNPDLWPRFGVWVKRGPWRRLLGGMAMGRRAVYVVDRVAGEVVLPPDAGSAEQNYQAVMEFKKIAYLAGRNLAESRNWCGTYEAAVVAAGLDGSAVS